MDNHTRSQISRKKAIDAALVILTRDGIGGLTFDTLSRESGISKGGLLHQFRTRNGVLAALLEYQRQQFAEIAQAYLDTEGASKKEPCLASQITVYKESSQQPHSIARAVLAALVEQPELACDMQDTDGQIVKQLKAESKDFDLSMLRYFAASGIAFCSLLGISQLPKATVTRLFDRLLDEDQWDNLGSAPKPRAKAR
ncbi:TetR/AcrR family transcriptional regulator [Burkholderia sp. Ac-20379]|uniref:TetR/AcrR family transcriptional regulator n=1 Tax=Burkholderia sp. Ac-20379 TaxID=2703900 RepID=UPI0019806020|nr:TetR/AcrR family transcriptional regulator [Burkholderia sp. Ac-20379]MBN3726807.1 TetR/AcrR family transcriptional regulator [Burkholderia sp. Ac-20379]